ncbi:MAG: rRNA maturation RNase YbeY [Patescibacteria group bacterium]
MSTNFTLINKTKATLPRVAFSVIKKAALGDKYKLSVTFVPPAHIKKLNLIYRNKNEATDILSFPLSKNEGEIYISPSEARKEAKKFDRPYANFMAFLFIHGCTHLKGYDHGSTMERVEVKLRKKFKV